MSRTKSTSSGKGGDGSKRRTRRACDRCRIKKAKCDGASRCKTCKANDSPCTYTARRGRDARSYYCRMRDVFDEAVQRLYWACRQERGFPGEIPDESSGTVTTDAILCGLGLIEPGGEDSTTMATATAKTSKELSDFSETQRFGHDHDRRPWTLSTARDFTQTQNDQEDPSSPSQSPPSPSSRSYDIDGSASGSVPSLQTATTNETNFDLNADVDQQDLNVPSTTAPSCETTPDNISSVPSTMAAADPGGYAVDVVESYLNVDAFLDATFCGAIPGDASATTMGDFTDAMLFKNNNISHHHHHGQAHGSLFPEQQVIPPTKGDSYLSPWPGSLAAAYSSVPTV